MKITLIEAALASDAFSLSKELKAAKDCLTRRNALLARAQFIQKASAADYDAKVRQYSKSDWKNTARLSSRFVLFVFSLSSN